MKGLEEELESQEREAIFRTKVATYVALIVFSGASLFKEIFSYVYDKIDTDG